MSTLATCTSGTRPASPSNGDVVYETDTRRLAVWDNAASVWRIYGSDSIAYNTLGTDELHYPTGLWSSASATYYISTSPEIHFDARILDGADAANNPSDGSSVSSWGNRSGSTTDYTATQSTGGNQPLWKTSGSGVTSNVPTVEADGSDNLSMATEITFSGEMTVIYVQKSDVASTSVVTSDSALWQDTIWNKFASNSSDYLWGGSKGDLSAPENFYMYAITRDSSNSGKFFENGNNLLNTTTTTRTMKMNHLLGNSPIGDHDGEVSEILVWTSHLSDADLNKVADYIDNKYGTTSTNW